MDAILASKLIDIVQGKRGPLEQDELPEGLRYCAECDELMMDDTGCQICENCLEAGVEPY